MPGITPENIGSLMPHDLLAAIGLFEAKFEDGE